MLADERHRFIDPWCEADERESPMAPAHTFIQKSAGAFGRRHARKNSRRVVEREREKDISSDRDHRVALDLVPRKKAERSCRKRDSCLIENERSVTAAEGSISQNDRADGE